jgi:teichoic acid transport system permease protein
MFAKINIFFDFLKAIIQSRKMIGSMVVNDFKVKYASSALGITWAFVQPLVQMLVIIFVFTVGLKAGPTPTGIPFAPWLVCGLVPWNFFADAVTNGTNSLAEYSYLVKKVVFRTSILPVVKTLSSLIVHIVFIGILFVTTLCFGYTPTIYTLQLLYYLPCLIFLVFGLNWLCSALAVFFKDIAQLITVFLQLFVWLTPIMWDKSRIEGHFLELGSLKISLSTIFQANPVFYIVDGYRDAFTGSTWFWEKPGWTIYYLCFSTMMFILGATIFHKLRPHFSDVL